MKYTKIPKQPKAGDTISSLSLGHRSDHIMIWNACPKCGDYRWVCNTRSEHKRECRACAREKYLLPRPYRQTQTISITDIPKEGDIIRGKELNKKDRLYQWVVCPDCNIGRWVIKSTVSLYKKCYECGNRTKKTYIGEASSQWKGGRFISRQGYVYVIVRKSSPYYPMANHIGYVAEHRLIIARKLKRCLERWEVIHHKHTRFPAGSREDKQDNRPENLELIPTRHTHNTITILERQVSELRQQVAGLVIKVKLCEWRIKELEGIKNKEV